MEIDQAIEGKGERVLRGDRSARRKMGKRVLRDSPFKKDFGVEMPGDDSQGGSSWKRALTRVSRSGRGAGG